MKKITTQRSYLFFYKKLNLNNCLLKYYKMTLLVTLDTLDEIFRFTETPQFVLYFKKLMSRQTIRVLYKKMSIDKQATKGNLQTIKYLHLIGVKCTTNVIECASSNGFLDVVKYLHETVGVKCTTDAMDCASTNGFLDVIKYLHETVGAKCTTDAMDRASSNGFLDVVKYLHETVGVGCTTNAMIWASANGLH